MNIIFDLDGTLIDSAPDIHAAANAVLAAEGLGQVTPDQARSFIGNGARVFVERLERAGAGANEDARTARMHAQFLAQYETAHALTRPYPGVDAALDSFAAHGWALGLCTNKPLKPALAVLAHFAWTGRFAAVIGGDSLPVMKPDPAPLLAVLAQMGGGAAVYVGDSEVDAATARAAGLPFALFTEGYRRSPLDQIPHDAAFSDFAALPDLAAALLRG
jgi:phosphoglycolate phosphatase